METGVTHQENVQDPETCVSKTTPLPRTGPRHAARPGAQAQGSAPGCVGTEARCPRPGGGRAGLRGQPPAPSITPRAISPPGNAEASGRGDDGDRDGDGVGRSVSRARPRPLAYPSRDHAAGNPQFYAAFVNYRALDGCAHVPSHRVRCEGGRCACAGQAPAPDGASDPRLPPAPQITELQLHSLRRSGPAAAERPGSGPSPSQGSEGPARPQARTRRGWGAGLGGVCSH